jgi:hypothetical protein
VCEGGRAGFEWVAGRRKRCEKGLEGFLLELKGRVVRSVVCICMCEKIGEEEKECGDKPTHFLTAALVHTSRSWGLAT